MFIFQNVTACLAFLDIPKEFLMNRFSVQWSNSGLIKISRVQVEDSRWSLPLMSGHSSPFSSSCAQCSRDCSIPLGSFIQRWSSRPSRRVLSQGTDVTIFLLVIPIQNTPVQAWNWLIAQFESLRWRCWLLQERSPSNSMKISASGAPPILRKYFCLKKLPTPPMGHHYDP